MKEVFNKYIKDELKLNIKQKIAILCLIIVISGFIGWLYEFIFYYFNWGMKGFYLQGGNFLPWINIYAIGALMIMFLTKKVKNKPMLVFLISFISTGILEYFSGFIIYHLFDGLRLWNYNTEILNFGNIGGFVCLRSVMCFGLSGLLLVYLVIPFCINLSIKINTNTLLVISILLLSIVLIDELYNLIFARIFNTPRASEVYKSMGFSYLPNDNIQNKK